ncbi:MAG: TetR/AcrR family transcriptional regulator [Acidimicrobiia bacterium]|nr:TetR/AcrR family transcriptional regulator [Acidimicrobiia bacterium]
MTTRLPAQERRQQLLDVALQVFSGAGYHATTMDDIAATAGVTKPVLYQHFSSKRALYLHLVDDVGDRMARAITDSTSRADSPRRQVEVGIGTYFHFIADNRAAFLLLFEGADRTDQDVADAMSRIEDSMAELVAPLIAAGIDADQQRALAYGIVGAAEAAGRAWATGKLRTDLDLLAVEIAELAWSGLRGISRH